MKDFTFKEFLIEFLATCAAIVFLAMAIGLASVVMNAGGGA